VPGATSSTSQLSNRLGDGQVTITDNPATDAPPGGCTSPTPSPTPAASGSGVVVTFTG
jgi:hypothetical protein